MQFPQKNGNCIFSCFSPFRSLLFRFSGIGVRGFPCKRAKDIFALCLRERQRYFSVNNTWHRTDGCQHISTYHIPSSVAAKSACVYGFHIFFAANICLILCFVCCFFRFYVTIQISKATVLLLRNFLLIFLSVI